MIFSALVALKFFVLELFTASVLKFNWLNSPCILWPCSMHLLVPEAFESRIFCIFYIDNRVIHESRFLLFITKPYNFCVLFLYWRGSCIIEAAMADILAFFSSATWVFNVTFFLKKWYIYILQINFYLVLECIFLSCFVLDFRRKPSVFHS